MKLTLLIVFSVYEHWEKEATSKKKNKKTQQQSN